MQIPLRGIIGSDRLCRSHIWEHYGEEGERVASLVNISCIIPHTVI